MKKILYVTTVNLTINAFLIPHIKQLIKNGHKVDVASNMCYEIPDEAKSFNYHHINFSRNPLSINNIKSKKAIKELFDKEKYDVVHVHTPVASFVTRMALKNEKVNIIYTAHGFHFYKGASILNWLIYYNLEKIAARWTDKLVTINTEDFNRAKKFKLRNSGDVYLMHGVGVKKEEYHVNNLDIKKYRQDLGLEENDFVILVLAELNKNKNQIQLIKAIEEIDKKTKIKVLLAGDGILENKLKKYVEERGLQENIKFLGFRKDVWELVCISDCIGLFSKREGLGKCLLEGMIGEKVLIATNTRGAREIIIDGKNGFIFDINDYKKTSEKIKYLYENKEKAIEMGKYSKKILDRYYLENVLKFLNKLY